MSKYSELIKNFDKIRDYMRDFYVYGFRSREEFRAKSARSYDDERRRIESYLGSCIAFERDKSGKRVFVTVDADCIFENPLLRAFEAKTFTRNDITLHFLILDLLAEGESLTAGEICERIAQEYLSFFEDPLPLDLATVRNKLREYVSLGILRSEKCGQKICFSRRADDVALEKLRPALAFFRETAPLGVVGSYLCRRTTPSPLPLTYRHPHLPSVLDSEVLYQLTQAIEKKSAVRLTNFSGSGRARIFEGLPLRFLISLQSGRSYVAVRQNSGKFTSVRLDFIKKVELLEPRFDFEESLALLLERLSVTWGTSLVSGPVRTLSMTLRIAPEENYVLARLNREGRQGSVEPAGENLYRYTVRLNDPNEAVPWLRTFLGRIESMSCDDPVMVKRFQRDLEQMRRMYQIAVPEPPDSFDGRRQTELAAEGSIREEGKV